MSLNDKCEEGYTWINEYKNKKGEKQGGFCLNNKWYEERDKMIKCYDKYPNIEDFSKLMKCVNKHRKIMKNIKNLGK